MERRRWPACSIMQGRNVPGTLLKDTPSYSKSPIWWTTLKVLVLKTFMVHFMDSGSIGKSK